jgi:hypothetical protein
MPGPVVGKESCTALQKHVAVALWTSDCSSVDRVALEADIIFVLICRMMMEVL